MDALLGLFGVAAILIAVIWLCVSLIRNAAATSRAIDAMSATLEAEQPTPEKIKCQLCGRRFFETTASQTSFGVTCLSCKTNIDPIPEGRILRDGADCGYPWCTQFSTSAPCPRCQRFGGIPRNFECGVEYVEGGEETVVESPGFTYRETRGPETLIVIEIPSILTKDGFTYHRYEIRKKRPDGHTDKTDRRINAFVKKIASGRIVKKPISMAEPHQSVSAVRKVKL